MQDHKLLPHGTPHDDQRFDHSEKRRMIFDEIEDAPFKLSPGDHADLEAEVTQKTADAVLDIDELRLQELSPA